MRFFAHVCMLKLIPNQGEMACSFDTANMLTIRAVLHSASVPIVVLIHF